MAMIHLTSLCKTNMHVSTVRKQKRKKKKKKQKNNKEEQKEEEAEECNLTIIYTLTPLYVNDHVAMVHGHVWRTLCSVCATGARVAHPVPCNS